MTTRRAASHAASSQANSAAPSAADPESRRGSFASEGAQHDGNAEVGERPAKRSRVTSSSTMTDTPQVVSSSSSRKNSAASVLTEENASRPQSSGSNHSMNLRRPRRQFLDVDTPVESGSPKEEMVNGVDIDTRDSPLPNGHDQVAITPAATPAATPFSKKTGLRRVGRNPQDSTVTSNVNSANGTPAPVSHGPDIKRKNRRPGKKRGTHANPIIEALMLRKDHTKEEFELVTEAVKPILLELSRRSLDALENQSDAHVAVPEYQRLQAELDKRLERRLADLDNGFKLQTEYYARRLAKELDRIEDTYIAEFQNLQDDRILRIKQDVLLAERNASAQDGNATEIEVSSMLHSKSNRG